MLKIVALVALALLASTQVTSFTATINTDVTGFPPIVFNITEELAPLGVARFKELVYSGFYEQAPFFRYVDAFIVQFGIAYDPEVNAKYAHNEIKDDPVTMSNEKGTLVYATAGPDTRTSQLFINFQDNAGLDAQGFAPFGQIISGLETAVAIFNPTPDDDGGINQNQLSLKGGAWADETYPGLNHITSITIE